MHFTLVNGQREETQKPSNHQLSAKETTQPPTASLHCYQTTILTIRGYILLSAGNTKQADAAEVIILSKQETVFHTGQLRVMKKTAYQQQQGKQKHPSVLKKVFHNRVTIYQGSNRDLKYFPLQLP